MTDELRSIAAQAPEDISGRRSRSGYHYQDLCALRYCIKAACDGSWEEVWCESHDDIVLYKRSSNSERYRFIQVKYSGGANQHWSCAMLCRTAKNRTIGESIICKLFLKDRFAGESDFRLATNEGVSDELERFLYRWNREEPSIERAHPDAQSLLSHLLTWTPPDGRSVEDFVCRFAIERHAADADDMVEAIAKELNDFLQRHRLRLFRDELEIVFRYLYFEVYKAAEADLDQSGHPERIAQSAFREAALTSARATSDGTVEVADAEPSSVLRSELTGIDIDDGTIENAIELRRGYLNTWRQNTGTEVGNAIQTAMTDIQAICAEESVKISGSQGGSGRALLLSLLTRIDEVHASSQYGKRGVSLGLMHGMVYFLIARKRLRLAR